MLPAEARLTKARQLVEQGLFFSLHAPRQVGKTPIVARKLLTPDVMNDDLLYVRDLGLVVTDPEIRIANPIYQEVIPRYLTYVLQRTIPAKTSLHVRPDGGLDFGA